MNKLGYKEFQNDVRNIFSTIMLKYSMHQINIKDAESDYISLLENTNCKIELNQLQNFPHIGVVMLLYLKCNEEEIIITNRLISLFLGIDKDEIIKYYQDFDKKYKLSQQTNKREIVKLHLIYNDSILKNFWFPFLDGTYTYILFNKWYNYVKNAFDVDNRSIKLPSYKEIEGK